MRVPPLQNGSTVRVRPRQLPHVARPQAQPGAMPARSGAEKGQLDANQTAAAAVRGGQPLLPPRWQVGQLRLYLSDQIFGGLTM